MGEALMRVDRRTLLLAGGAAALFGGAAYGATTPASRPLAVGKRSTTLTVWEAARPRGVALFSHGHGSWPERYALLAAFLTERGFSVYAPLHVDSVRHPDRAAFSMQASFGERLADLSAAAAIAAAAVPGRPMVAAGHSFGTLSAACLGGALDYVGKFRDPRVTAVLGFSTPGKVPGLIQPSAYASLAVPILVVTGTADTVPGFVTDPADHLFPAETAGHGGYALVEAGGGHDLVADAARLMRATPPVDAFLRGHGLNDAPARARLGGWRAPAGDRFVVKKA